MLSLISKYRWWLILASATIFLLMFRFELSVLPEAIADKCKEPAHGYNNYCPGYVVAGAFLDSAAAFLKPYSDALTAIAGLIVAIFTATLWTTTRQMWRASVEQLRHSEVTAERQLRAYVMIEKAHIENLQIGKTPKARIVIKNWGQTPAYNVTHWCAVGFGPYPIPPNNPLPGSDEEEVEMPPRPIAPGGDFHLWADGDCEINQVRMNALKSGHYAIYVAGCVRYTDAFRRNRTTDFLLLAGGPIPLDGSLGGYPRGNRAD